MNYSKNLVFVAACAGMSFFGVAMLTMGAVLPNLTEKFELGELAASSLVTLLPLGILMGSFIFGPIMDKFGYKWLLIGSSLFCILGLLGLSLLENMNYLRFCIFLIGFGGGILNGETNALVSDIYDDNKRGSRLSILGIFYCLGALGLPLLFASLSDRFPFESILKGMSGFMALFIVYFLFVRFPQAKAAESFSMKRYFDLFKQPVLLLFSFVLFFQSGFEGLCNNWSTSYLGNTTALSEDAIMFSLTWLVVGILAGRLILGWLLTRVKGIVVLYACLLTALLGVVSLSFSNHPVMIDLSMVLIGMGTAATFPVVFGYLGGIYKDLSGTAFSIALAIALIGNTLLNYIMGLIGIDKFPVLVATSLIAMILVLTISVQTIKHTQKS